MRLRTSFSVVILFLASVTPTAGAVSKVTNSVVWWGDSLTAGAGGAGITAPSELQKILKIPVVNMGVGGEGSSAIAARSGAREISLRFFGLGKKEGDWTKYQVVPDTGILRQGINVLAGEIQGCVVFLKFEGAGYSAKAFKCQKNLKNKIFKFKVAGIENLNSKYKIIWSGRNNGGDSATVSSDIAAMISFFKGINPKVKVYVLSVINGAGEGRGSGAYAGINAVNQALSTVNANYIDVRRCLIDEGLDVNNLSASEQDILDVENDLVPEQLRSDGIHLNSYGYHAVAYCVSQAMKLTS